MDVLAEANGTFALNLLKTLGKDNSKNVFFSPMSMSCALAMVYMGAKGNTAAQMAQVQLQGSHGCYSLSSELLLHIPNRRGISGDG